ncbi:nuclear pore complex protein Nup93 [Tetranychus urticae]|uniref:Nuclear pore protein n=1 Tax=Tetranychus urticae TaxID=32264 RepID=T1KIQ5_TETUR|nr:nuclear pore complex protein Nup93 [Tetranychus urticae]
MEVSNFDDLLQKAEQLQAQVDLPFPRIERNIKQLYEVGHNLWTRTGYHASRDSNEARASVLLGAKGYDLQKANQQLENLKADFSTVESSKISDIHGFLKNERENAVLSSIEEVKKNTFETVDKKCWAKTNKDWEDQKMNILTNLVGDDNDVSDVSMMSVSRSAATPKINMRDLSSRVIQKDFTSYVPILEKIKKAPNDQNISALSSLLRENKDFESVLGYKNRDGNRVAGLIDQYHDDPVQVIQHIANDCEETGSIEEAVKLQDLTRNDEKCLELLIKYLTPLVPQKKTSGGLRDKLENLAINIAERYHSSGYNARPEVVGIFHLLLDLMAFFDNYHKQAFDDALEVIEKLNILPFRMEQVDAKANEFGSYADEIRQLIPDVLVATMNIIHIQYKKIKSIVPLTSNKFGVIAEANEKDVLLQSLKAKARLLITYAGMIPYRMPGDINARLVQLEVTMN